MNKNSPEIKASKCQFVIPLENQEAYKQRLLTEDFELCNKISRLNLFILEHIFDMTKEQEREKFFLLRQQLEVMKLYEKILSRRMELEHIHFGSVTKEDEK